MDNAEDHTGNTLEQAAQKRILWTVLAINFIFFILEMTTGLLSRSMGLVADSLDMLADAFVYGLSLMAVGGSILMKNRTARIAGILQFLLALSGFAEVIRRFSDSDAVPDYRMMIMVSALAMVGNGICLFLLHKSRSSEAHMKASMIFTSNDVLINFGVILAALLVLAFQSSIPDLVIGTAVFLIVFRASIRIYRLGK